MNRTAQLGDRAWNTPGSFTTCVSPNNAITVNQISITGPKSQPIVPDPNRCTANRPMRIASDSGTTRWVSAVEATDTPPTAPSTEIAGVMIPSPKNNAAPKIPSDHQDRSVGDSVALQQRGERHDPAVSAVVGPHDEPGVLDRDDDHQSPEDERRGPEHVQCGDHARGVVVGEDRLLGVEGARADVAIDDPEGAEGQDRLAGVGDDVAVDVLEGLEPPAGLLRLLLVGALRRRPVAKLVRGLVERPLLGAVAAANAVAGPNGNLTLGGLVGRLVVGALMRRVAHVRGPGAPGEHARHAGSEPRAGRAQFSPLSVAVFPESVFTESVWLGSVSACALHAPRARMRPMDVVSILLGVLMFAILIALDLRDRRDMTLVVASIGGADLFGLIVSLLVCIYLLYALLRGEKF